MGANMGPSGNTDNRKKDILLLATGLMQGLDDTSLTTEKQYSIKIILSLHYNRMNSYKIVNDVETYKFKAEDSEIPAPLCLDNVSKDFSVDNTQKAGLYEYIYDFLVSYDIIDVVDLLQIHKYLMKKHSAWIYLLKICLLS